MKLKRFLKRFITLALAMILSLSAFACSKGGDGDGESISDVEFWSCYSTLKVFQDKTDMYEQDKQPAVINLNIARGEKEAAQLIMTNIGDAKTYEIEVSDLISGDNVIPKDNVVVFHEKYIWVVGSEFYTDEAYYPDCLVPYDNVKSVGENVIKENSNQGLYVRFDLPTDQPVGQYTGNLKISISGGEQVIPITLNVLNAYVTDTTHSLSIFNTAWYLSRGELDTTEAMFDNYIDMLTEYRCGTQTLIMNNYGKDEDIQHYAERACEYVKKENSICFGVPKSISEYYDYELDGEIFTGGQYVYHPLPIYKMYKALAYEGLKQNVDVFSKCIQIGYDEPNGTDQWKIEYSSQVVRKMKDKVIAELQNDASIQNIELRDKLCASLDKVPHVVTLDKVADTVSWELGVNEDFVYCPYFSSCGSESARDMYRIEEDNQLWWYGCCSPDYPYPTYHTDDTLISSRVVSWMQYEYDVIGNLYWSTDYYTSGNTSEVDKTGYLEDYYENAVRSTRTNGEGYLVYPGKKYGVEGPLPSLRLESIRDGMEEYELMYYLEKIYESVNARTGKSFDVNSIINSLGKTMYNGTKVYTTDAVFATARENLLTICDLAQSKANLLVTDMNEGIGYMDFEVYCNDGYTPTYNVGEITNTETLNGGKLYTVRVSIGTASHFNVSVEIDGKTYTVGNKLPSTATVYDASYLKDKIKQFNNNTPATISQENDVFGYDKALKIDFTERAWNLATIHALKFVDDKTLGKINASTDKLVLRLYNSSSEDRTFFMNVEYKDDEGIYNENQYVLKPGENMITLANLSGVKWSKRGKITSLRLMFGGLADANIKDVVYSGKFICEANADIYLIDMSIYNV